MIHPHICLLLLNIIILVFLIISLCTQQWQWLYPASNLSIYQQYHSSFSANKGNQSPLRIAVTTIHQPHNRCTALRARSRPHNKTSRDARIRAFRAPSPASHFPLYKCLFTRARFKAAISRTRAVLSRKIGARGSWMNARYASPSLINRVPHISIRWTLRFHSWNTRSCRVDSRIRGAPSAIIVSRPYESRVGGEKREDKSSARIDDDLQCVYTGTYRGWSRSIISPWISAAGGRLFFVVIN